MFELAPMDMMQLTSAVRSIVHPNAQPTPAMMAIATRQGAPPRTFLQMLEYTPHFVDLAMRMGVRPPGVNGTVSPQVMREYMIARGNQWMQQQTQLAGMTGGQMGLGSEMTGLGGLGMGMGMGPMAALTGGQQLGATPGMGMGTGFGTGTGMGTGMGMGMSPMSLMLLDSGMESPALQMSLLNSPGMRNPLSMMYFMENAI